MILMLHLQYSMRDNAVFQQLHVLVVVVWGGGGGGGGGRERYSLKILVGLCVMFRETLTLYTRIKPTM